MKGQNFHHLTGIFSTTIWDRIALVKDNWSHYALLIKIQQGTLKHKNIITKTKPITNVYQDYPSPMSSDLKKVMEYNHPTHFDSLRFFGINTRYYTPGNSLDTPSQAEPDIIISNKNSVFIDQREHGVDIKASEKIPNETDSRAFSQVSTQNYRKSLLDFENLILLNLTDLNTKHFKDISKALSLLSERCEDINQHLFPKGYIPPLLITDNFSISNLKPEYLEEFKKAQLKMEAFSKTLFKNKIPNKIPIDHADFITAIDILNDIDFYQQEAQEALTALYSETPP